MKAVFTYEEITDLIHRKYQIRPTFQFVDTKTIEVHYKPTHLFPKINILLHLESVAKEAVRMSYDCSKGTSLLIGSIAGFLGSKIPDGIEINILDKCFHMILERFEKTKNISEYLTDIVFTNNNVEVYFTLF